ncbi:hypothetical protein [Sinorhizobium meliloti]|uniref:hypothetical protein n=1 Tax=Rhizobium meliloti TaxID=382 RepID=UPI000FDAD0E3|nr:hypothetical protein [Sinorhizobium meliloti]RVG19723.1 hypothetical protein CN231_07655 [Sinorhizobium meliloti]
MGAPLHECISERTHVADVGCIDKNISSRPTADAHTGLLGTFQQKSGHLRATEKCDEWMPFMVATASIGTSVAARKRQTASSRKRDNRGGHSDIEAVDSVGVFVEFVFDRRVFVVEIMGILKA